VLMADGNYQLLHHPLPQYQLPGGFPQAGYAGSVYLPLSVPSLSGGRRLEAALRHVELELRAVLTVNAYRRLTEDLAGSGPDVCCCLQLLQDKGLDLCHQVIVCLGLPWGTLYPRPLAAPPPCGVRKCQW
jgi:hypothetical protein